MSVFDIAGVYSLFVNPCSFYTKKSVFHSHSGLQAYVFYRHDRADAVLRVFEHVVYVIAGFGICIAENLSDYVSRHLFYQIYCIVQIQLI